VIIGLVNPGAMGATIGAALVRSGHEVLWVAEGRSTESRERARDAGLTPVDSLTTLVGSAEGLMSVCPPHAAPAVAQSVLAAGFDGLYVDANAVAPQTARSLAELFGSQYVDGALIGPPARREGTTRLYLSGADAARVRNWFDEPVLGVSVVDDRPGSASALKMCYAAYTKGTSALILAIRALAEAEGVDESLLEEWTISQPDLISRSEGAARGTAGKAWRFVGEMEEIAATFEARNLPGGFHRAAAEVYGRMEGLKDEPDADLARVVATLLDRAEDGAG
jgi:3-hydroxyisobutyrate dehydrogenase-like beta-hydroxyacid dehydrogenase